VKSGDCIAWMDACAIDLNFGESCDPQDLSADSKRRRVFLGKGAYGTVYEGKKTSRNGRKTTRVAVKIIDTASLLLIGTDISKTQLTQSPGKRANGSACALGSRLSVIRILSSLKRIVSMLACRAHRGCISCTNSGLDALFVRCKIRKL
jgi:hypothetical protein